MAISSELFTAVVTFLSKYLSRAEVNINNENNEINIEGIKVNKAKKVMYFLFALEPLISMSILNCEIKCYAFVILNNLSR